MAYIGVQPAEAYTSFAVQHFTTSATTSYTLDNPVANENEIALFINNVRQQPGSSYAYTASGTTLTLSAATSASDTMYCVFIGKAVQTVTPTLPIANFSSTGIDDNADATAITIDSSENVLVGKTSTTFATAGVNLQPNGRVDVTRDGGQTVYFNRTTSDGNIVGFYKDGSAVGTIGSFSPLIYLAGSSNAVAVGNGNIVPATTTGGISDNALDLGASNRRWQDLYLGGNIYLGGTGSANALDDYEEGTFTPTYAASGGGGDQPTVSYGTQVGRYTKVGRLVTVFIAFNTTSASNLGGTSNHRLRIAGLPFDQDRGGSGISPGTNWADLQNGVCITASSGAVLRLTGIEGGNTTVDLFTDDLRTSSDSNQMAFSYQYEIA